VAVDVPEEGALGVVLWNLKHCGRGVGMMMMVVVEVEEEEEEGWLVGFFFPTVLFLQQRGPTNPRKQ
jgi:hypothetical protein